MFKVSSRGWVMLAYSYSYSLIHKKSNKIAFASLRVFFFFFQPGITGHLYQLFYFNACIYVMQCNEFSLTWKNNKMRWVKKCPHHDPVLEPFQISKENSEYCLSSDTFLWPPSLPQSIFANCSGTQPGHHVKWWTCHAPQNAWADWLKLVCDRLFPAADELKKKKKQMALLNRFCGWKNIFLKTKH